MYNELQELLRKRYEIVGHRIAALKEEIEKLEPERENLLELISFYSQRGGDDFIENERSKLYKGGKKKTFIKPEVYERTLKDIFTDTNNEPAQIGAIQRALNEALEVTMSYATAQRVIKDALDKGLLKVIESENGGYKKFCLK